MSIPRTPYFGTYLFDEDARPGMIPRWPHKDATTEFPLTALAFAFLCRFNGVSMKQAPRSWMYAPNRHMQVMLEMWSLQDREIQDAYIAWSRKPGQNGKPFMTRRIDAVPVKPKQPAAEDDAFFDL